FLPNHGTLLRVDVGIPGAEGRCNQWQRRRFAARFGPAVGFRPPQRSANVAARTRFRERRVLRRPRVSPWSETPHESPADLERRLGDLANLYEVARSLLGARDPGRIASRIVLATMGTLGARSGALYRADERGRLRLASHHPPETMARGGVLRIERAAREWMLREGAFALEGAETSHGLGTLRDRLVERHEAAVGAAIADRYGLAGLLLLGPRLLGDPFGPAGLALLDSVAGLASLALGDRAPASGAMRQRRAE